MEGVDGRRQQMGRQQVRYYSFITSHLSWLSFRCAPFNEGRRTRCSQETARGGEMLDFKNTVNGMVFGKWSSIHLQIPFLLCCCRLCAPAEVTHVALEVGSHTYMDSSYWTFHRIADRLCSYEAAVLIFLPTTILQDHERLLHLSSRYLPMPTPLHPPGGKPKKVGCSSTPTRRWGCLVWIGSECNPFPTHSSCIRLLDTEAWDSSEGSNDNLERYVIYLRSTTQS